MRPTCGEEIEAAAVKCRHCGRALSDGSASVLAEVADAEIKLRPLILNVAAYARQFRQILTAPLGYFRQLDYTDNAGFKPALAFMLQGITVGFMLFIMGTVLPQSIACFYAIGVPLMLDTREQLLVYANRTEQVRSVLPPALIEQWFKQAELMVAVRILPDDRFQRLVERLRELSKTNPDWLEPVINGSLTYGNRFGGRGYMLTFFSFLDPHIGALGRVSRQMTDIGPRYDLKAPTSTSCCAPCFFGT
jgi:hypothetical protein